MYRKVFIIFFLFGISAFIFQKSQTKLSDPISAKSNAEEIILQEADTTLITPSIESIFSPDHSWIATLAAERKRTILVTGDVIPARVVNIQATKFNNYLWPFEKTADVVKDADLTFIDLETPIIKNCPLINDGFKFCGNARHVEGLVYAGVDVATLANNHIGNFGEEAISETVSILESNGIAVTGQHQPLIKDIRGVTFAFLGYNDIGYTPASISDAEEEKIKREITKARQQADVIIVQYHWGEEYRSQPDDRQKYLGKFTIDAGADLVIGNHPHWIQPVEMYKNKLITYAHGNFVFDQEWSIETKQGVVGRYTYFDDQLIDIEYLPIQIENYGQPYFLKGERKQKILDHMKSESVKLSIIKH